MKTVQVLLREDIDKLGRCGDVVRVAAGYARNYLLPRSAAVEATPENVQLMARRRARLDAQEAARSKEIAVRVTRLQGVRLKTVERADDQGHLYGSVNAARVSELLLAAGQQVTERDVRLEAPLKRTGEHTVRVHVFGQHFAEVTLEVEAASEPD